MLVYVDESGDTVMTGAAGASAYFVVAAVIFQDQSEATRCSKAIQELKSELHWPEGTEFHFTDLNDKVRIGFFRVISPFKFRYCWFALDKKKIYGRGFQYHRSCYKFPIRMLFTNAQRYLHEATVCIDRSGNEEFANELEKYVKRHINTNADEVFVSELRMADSRSDNLLQLADMVSGATLRVLRADKKDHGKYRPLIIDKEQAGSQKWPKRRLPVTLTRNKG